MIRICSKCGALLLEDPNVCTFCDVSQKQQIPEPAAVAVAASSERPSNAPEWQREVSRRLAHYRSRKQRVEPKAGTQHGLPFVSTTMTVSKTLAAPAPAGDSAPAPSAQEARLPEPPKMRPWPRNHNPERLDICVQPEFDFSKSSSERGHPQTSLVPVAALSERRIAGAVDLVFIGMTCTMFLALFRSLGGEILFARADAAVCLSVLYLFYGLYFFVFTIFAGASPGMQLRNLTVVRLDGTLPSTEELLWRSFGCLLSGATLLGFAWALWDEDRFTWQDRISHTYITAAMPAVDGCQAEMRSDAAWLAHK